MIAAHVRPEPRPVERIELRRQPDEAVREQHVREILDPQVIGDQQVPDLVLRIQQQQRHRLPARTMSSSPPQIASNSLRAGSPP